MGYPVQLFLFLTDDFFESIDDNTKQISFGGVDPSCLQTNYGTETQKSVRPILQITVVVLMHKCVRQSWIVSLICQYCAVMRLCFEVCWFLTIKQLCLSLALLQGSKQHLYFATWSNACGMPRLLKSASYCAMAFSVEEGVVLVGGDQKAVLNLSSTRSCQRDNMWQHVTTRDNTDPQCF